MKLSEKFIEKYCEVHEGEGYKWTMLLNGGVALDNIISDEFLRWLDENSNLHERMVMQKIAEALKEIVWMARRYADGRQTFSPRSFNDAYDTLRDIFGKDIEYNDVDKWVDHTLTENGKYFPYAQDGGDRKHFDAVTGRKYSNFTV